MIENRGAGLVRSKWLKKGITEGTLRRVAAAIFERVCCANGYPIQRFHVLTLIGRCLVIDLEVIVS